MVATQKALLNLWKKDSDFKRKTNDEIEKIPLTPLEVSIREKIGYVIDPKKINEIPTILTEINDKPRTEEIRQIRSQTVFNVGTSAKVGAEYIVKILDS